jgi:hypothetical protein
MFVLTSLDRGDELTAAIVIVSVEGALLDRRDVQQLTVLGADRVRDDRLMQVADKPSNEEEAQ